MEELSEARILRLEPGDKLLIELDSHVPQSAVVEIKERMEEHFPGVPVLIVGGGAHLSVIRPEGVAA